MSLDGERRGIEATTEEAGLVRARRSRSAIEVVIAGAADSWRDQIMAALAGLTALSVEVSSAATSEPGAPRTGSIAIAVMSNDRETWALEVAEIRDQTGCAAVIAALGARSSEGVREALRAGADDVIFLPPDGADLSRCLIRLAEAAPTEANRRGTVCALTSVAGGSGVTTLTAALGLAIRRLSGKRVVLVDLAAQAGTLGALLDVKPEHTLAELIDPTTTLDSIRLEASLTAHKSGVYLLAAPRRIEQSELITADTVTPTLELLRELFDYILVDCGHQMSETLVAAWEMANLLIYPVEQAVTSVRPARRFLEMFGRLKLGELDPQFILNKYEAKNPFTAAKIAAALGYQPALTIPRDDETFIRMQIASEDMASVAGKSAARAAIDQYASGLCGIAPARVKARHGALPARIGGWVRSAAARVRRKGAEAANGAGPAGGSGSRAIASIAE